MIDYKSIAVQLAGTVDHIMTELAAETDITYEQQGLVVSSGVNSFTFKTEVVPKKIYVTIESGDAQVCGGNVDKAGVAINNDGFTIYADIASNTATIKWIMMV